MGKTANPFTPSAWVDVPGANPSAVQGDFTSDVSLKPVRSAQSRAASARYGVTCPACKAESYAPCRTLRSGRVTDTHRARISEAYPTLGR